MSTKPIDLARDDWGKGLVELSGRLKRLAEALLLAKDSPLLGHTELRAALEQEFGKLISVVDELSDRLRERPLAQLLNGVDLSREAFYLLLARLEVVAGRPLDKDDAYPFSLEAVHLQLARGVLQVHTDRGDPYEAFQMLRYEDDDRRSYINPDQRPLPDGRIKVRFGVPPEGVLWDRLRPEQRNYFERHLPDLAARFKRET